MGLHYHPGGNKPSQHGCCPWLLSPRLQYCGKRSNCRTSWLEVVAVASHLHPTPTLPYQTGHTSQRSKGLGTFHAGAVHGYGRHGFEGLAQKLFHRILFANFAYTRITRKLNLASLDTIGARTQIVGFLKGLVIGDTPRVKVLEATPGLLRRFTSQFVLLRHGGKTTNFHKRGCGICTSKSRFAASHIAACFGECHGTSGCR